MILTERKQYKLKQAPIACWEAMVKTCCRNSTQGNENIREKGLILCIHARQ